MSPERNGFGWIRRNYQWIIPAVAVVLWAFRIDSFVMESKGTHDALLKIVERLDERTTVLEDLEVSKQEKREWVRMLCDEGPPNGLAEDSVRCLWVRGYPK